MTYNHFDSYPSGLGQTILDFVKETSLDELKAIAERIQLVNEDVKPTVEQIKKYSALKNLNVSSGDPFEWYVLLRNSQGEPQMYRDNGLDVMIDSASFLLDSLFCEYAYIINIDTGMFEFYEGFNEVKGTGRYDSKKKSEKSSEYYGVRLIHEVPLTQIQAGEYDFPNEDE